jgi:adenine-specific DNA methylase
MVEKTEKKEKKHVQAPLPFQGQKRRYVKEFSRIIEALQPDIVVDLFGGSVLLSHLAKRASPKSSVIYNDIGYN